jgi:hypothetical protein
MGAKLPFGYISIEEVIEKWNEPLFAKAMAELYGIEPQRTGEEFEDFKRRCLDALKPTFSA